MTSVPISTAANSLDAYLERGPYIGYCYSYPHKTAYRTLKPPRDWATAWAGEKTDAMFLYVHLPFCEFRCGFCNLFTFSQPREELPQRYLETVRRQAAMVAREIDAPRFSRLAIGGGTPTYLTQQQLDQLFTTLTDELGVAGQAIPISLEASPATIDRAKLKTIRDFGVDRLSLGIQSFNDDDVGAMGRPQRRREVDAALDMIREQAFPTLNLDLIYGGAGQSVASWLASVEEALRYSPEEIFLYPLYVRPLTGLANVAHDRDDVRLACYQQGRDLLLSRGYRQLSMRMFQHEDASVQDDAPQYCCQSDGMVGLGCGARSYTRDLHYASTFAVKQAAIATIIEDYIGQSDAQLRRIEHGIQLNEQERRRRYLIISLLLVEGLSRTQYAEFFAADPLDDFPELWELVERDLAIVSDDRLQLTPGGIEQSDAIGPWLYSPVVRERMEAFSWSDA